MKLKAPYSAKVACQLVGLKQSRFNEMVAAGEFSCAPETVRGSGRKFEEKDLLALYCFQWFRNSMWANDNKASGFIACRILAALEQGVTENIAIAEFENGEVRVGGTSEIDGKDEINGWKIRTIFCVNVEMFRQELEQLKVNLVQKAINAQVEDLPEDNN